MANKVYDGIVEAVHYCADGQVDWVRMYVRRGQAWSDRMILSRLDLIKEIKSGKQVMLGQRVQYMAGTFDVTVPIKILGTDGKEVLLTAGTSTERDNLEGVPVL